METRGGEVPSRTMLGFPFRSSEQIIYYKCLENQMWSMRLNHACLSVLFRCSSALLVEREELLAQGWTFTTMFCRRFLGNEVKKKGGEGNSCFLISYL